MYFQNDTGDYMDFETANDTYYVTNLLPGVTYDFTVVAINDIGESAASDVLTITTLEEGKNFNLYFNPHNLIWSGTCSSYRFPSECVDNIGL